MWTVNNAHIRAASLAKIRNATRVVADVRSSPAFGGLISMTFGFEGGHAVSKIEKK